MARDRVATLAIALVLVGDGAAGGFPWSIDMFRGPSVQPLAQPPRVTPQGALPVSGGERPMTREEAALKLRNPLAATPAHLEHGRELFETNCAPCHGSLGKGDGPVATHTGKPATDLTVGPPTERSDGYLYAVSRNGTGVMPPYGDATSVVERWELVMYLRQLQHGARP
jgi:mono/diheme cytochrome c family protein